MRCGAGRAPRVFPRLPRTSCPPFPPPFPAFPRVCTSRSRAQARERLLGALARPRPGLPHRIPRRATSARFAAWFICVWKGSTAPFPSKNNEIWDKLRSVCLSSILWLILCGYKCSYFIILICERLLLAVSSQVAAGTGAHMGRVWEMPNFTRSRSPLPESRSEPPDFPLPHLKLSEGSGVIAPCESWERGWIC